MGYVHQLPPFDLSMAPPDPLGKTLRVELLASIQGLVDGVYYEVEKVGFILKISAGSGEDDPVRGARVQYFCAARPQMAEKPAARSTPSRRSVGVRASVHHSVVEGHYLGVQLRIYRGQKRGDPVEVQSQIKKAFSREQSEKTGQHLRKVHEV